MNPVLKNSLMIFGGLIAGSVVNMSIISISGFIIPPPEGADITTLEGLRESMHLFEPKHFLFPFLAHAIGTFVGAFLVAYFAASHHLKCALGIGAFFLLGGSINVYLLPSPLWFSIADLIGAYIPMAYFAAKWAISLKNKNE